MTLHLCFKRIGINSPVRPYSTNRFYLMPVRIQCQFCKRTESHSKTYKSLWSIYRHFLAQHPQENPEFIIKQARILAKGGKKE